MFASSKQAAFANHHMKMKYESSSAVHYTNEFRPIIQQKNKRKAQHKFWISALMKLSAMVRSNS